MANDDGRVMNAMLTTLHQNARGQYDRVTVRLLAEAGAQAPGANVSAFI